MQNYDAIIIGNGPAGISAAIYLKRSGLNPLIISKNNSSLLKTHELENYYGFINPISGEELYQNGIAQAKRLGIKMIDDEVVGINFLGDYEVSTPSSIYMTKGVIIATGSTRNTPLIKGLKEYEGKGVSYCAICDGFFYRKKDVAVLGNKAYALHEANELVNIVNKVYILTDGKPLEFDNQKNYEIISKKIKEVSGDQFLSKVIFEDNQELNISGLFIALGTATSADFARKVGAEIKDNRIVVDEHMATNLPGLYACGDTTGGLLQVSKAVYEGAQAGTELAKYIKAQKNGK